MVVSRYIPSIFGLRGSGSDKNYRVVLWFAWGVTGRVLMLMFISVISYFVEM